MPAEETVDGRGSSAAPAGTNFVLARAVRGASLLSLRRSALRETRHPRTVAWLLQRELRAPEGSFLLAEQLGCSLRVVYLLALCDRARPAHFAGDAAAMAAYLGLDAERLSAVLQEAETRSGVRQ